MSFALILIAIVALNWQANTQKEGAGSAASAAVEEFRRVATAHRDQRSYDLQINVLVETNGSTVPIHAIVKCDEQHRCLRIFKNSTTLETPQLSLMVDTTDHTITVARNRQAASTKTTPSIDPAKMIDAWLESGGKLAVEELTPNGRRWTLDTGRPALPAVEMYVDENSHLLRRVAYESKGSDGTRTKVDIQYLWGDPASLDPAEFETSRFVQDQSGVIVPAKAYAQYKIISTDRR